MPALFASAEASSIESVSPRQERASQWVNRKHHSRVVMTTAFPTATFLKTDHMSRFIFASIPVLNSSMSRFVGFPTEKIFERYSRKVRRARQTYHGDSKGKLPLVSSRQLASQPIGVFSQSSCAQQCVHVPIELRSARNTFQPPVQHQMFTDGQLTVNCRELWANAQRESRPTRVLDDRDPVDEDVSFRWRNITSW